MSPSTSSPACHASAPSSSATWKSRATAAEQLNRGTMTGASITDPLTMPAIGFSPVMSDSQTPCSSTAARVVPVPE
ncbi:hypothetical protein WME76_19325 [Sorangium sp. So ce119]|uniref:hypothetical protein n=1 Tax=Sorangium sp. So ce119 TaxID=3133279 RepID=UPI003F62EB4D